MQILYKNLSDLSKNCVIRLENVAQQRGYVRKRFRNI